MLDVVVHVLRCSLVFLEPSPLIYLRKKGINGAVRKPQQYLAPPHTQYSMPENTMSDGINLHVHHTSAVVCSQARPSSSVRWLLLRASSQISSIVWQPSDEYVSLHHQPIKFIKTLRLTTRLAIILPAAIVQQNYTIPEYLINLLHMLTSFARHKNGRLGLTS